MRAKVIALRMALMAAVVGVAAAAAAVLPRLAAANQIDGTQPLARIAAADLPPVNADTADDPSHYLQFVEEFAATCVAREGVQILVRNTHPTRTLRVWLDRVHMGVGTGDRSRSDLPPGAEPEPLGCSRTLSGKQEWRLARALFID